MASINQFKSLVNAKNGIARSNLFRVKLPSLPGATMEELNILCKDVQLPGRQVLTNERRIKRFHMDTLLQILALHFMFLMIME